MDVTFHRVKRVGYKRNQSMGTYWVSIMVVIDGHNEQTEEHEITLFAKPEVLDQLFPEPTPIDNTGAAE